MNEHIAAWLMMLSQLGHPATGHKPPVDRAAVVERSQHAAPGCAGAASAAGRAARPACAAARPHEAIAQSASPGS